MVKSQAKTISKTVFLSTVFNPTAAPTPITPLTMLWVVEMGKPQPKIS